MAGEGYLHGVLADGVRRFRYRGRVRALLGMPGDAGAEVRFVPSMRGAFSRATANSEGFGDPGDVARSAESRPRTAIASRSLHALAVSPHPVDREMSTKCTGAPRSDEDGVPTADAAASGIRSGMTAHGESINNQHGWQDEPAVPRNEHPGAEESPASNVPQPIAPAESTPQRPGDGYRAPISDPPRHAMTKPDSEPKPTGHVRVAEASCPVELQDYIANGVPSIASDARSLPGDERLVPPSNDDGVGTVPTSAVPTAPPATRAAGRSADLQTAPATGMAAISDDSMSTDLGVIPNGSMSTTRSLEGGMPGYDRSAFPDRTVTSQSVPGRTAVTLDEHTDPATESADSPEESQPEARAETRAPGVIAVRPAPMTDGAVAFWERRYISLLRLRNLR
ncbi:hypothetical protein [Nocardia gipuzkoensis]|uniref:hypothetical protein n=1 Tax=Nocardia gipuzkoensis TaxID=2749991 RepID=UPI003EE07ECD